MSTTFIAPLGDRGRLVVPAALRAQQKWEQGIPLLFIETEQGVILTTQAQAQQLIRKQLAGASLVDALIDERRKAAADEDAA
ncbi:AbrB/MazE/SpoVT family DNA-binding domain-containing protein [Leucobacter insecticola]|uniref:AbrB/MazE/SpoVT family DNA-binding domain-containing protein n=1 Tax=Leucobacter insecticola TaxID=2714934 RepID=A0A6G8FJR5_9MICO|nr:AbrB/MazE/SpoVT family DNA-binding domain-containing protein [Leucobacter insecticola]QIM16617.1 AbrB/MazE/SpoVT family DNA-binding domain-containing protein [Leucobacter insecticola]